MMLDRTNLSEQGAIGSGNEPAPGPVFALSGEAQITRFIDYCASQPAYISLNIDDMYDAESDEVSIKVSGESLVDIGKDIYLNIFLTESGMINNQAGADNNYVHNHAIRANVTSTWGDVINLNADGSFEATYLYSLKSAWVPENMEVIAFVSDFNSTDANDCKVYNTEFKKLNVNTSVEGVASDGLKVWTSGRTLCIGGEYASAEIYNMSGLLVKSVRGDRFVDISQSGVYIVKIDGEVYKLVIR